MGDNNLIIPLLAYPAIENLQIPKNIHLPPTEVGQTDRLLEQSPDFSVSSLDLEVLAGEVSLAEAERTRALRAGTMRAMKEYQRRRAKQLTLKEIPAVEPHGVLSITLIPAFPPEEHLFIRRVVMG
ncbi:unnamed protein product [Dibothriocephalus latus]|uniref:Uncharacterized protein n=1 Tax=Dibothriocephalus latus TaxID=60516 RepID=A0A3P7NKP3_DIBLA|nr:unnamed protein product [Dibothriocephalus latus]